MENSASIEPSDMQIQAPISRFDAMNFWKLWGANSFSNLGDGLYQITLPLLAVHITSSPSLVAGVSVMLGLPWLIFALQAGSIVDRFERRRIMLWVTGGRVVILFAISYAIVTQAVSVIFLYAVALLLGIGETLVDTALTSIVPAVVPKNRLNWANARITASQTVTNTFIGPPLAGYLAGVSFALATGSSALMYVMTAVCLALMQRTTAAPPEKSEQRLWAHLTEGIRFVWKNRLIRKLTLFTASMNFFWAGWGALFVLYAVAPGPMALGEFEYGLLLTAMAAGGLAGSLLCERIQKKIGTRNALALDFIGTAALVGVPALTTNPLAAGAAVFTAGFGASIWIILVASIRQRLVPGELLGRVYSGSRFISWGIGPLGAAAAGVIAQAWGMRTLFAVSGAAGVGLLVLFLLAIPSHVFEGEAGGEEGKG